MNDKREQGITHDQEQAQRTDVLPETEAGTFPTGQGSSNQADSATPVRTPLGNMTLTMFEKGQYVRVRVGALHNATELYEHAFDSIDEANTALRDAGILTADQVPDLTKLAGTGIELSNVTAEQLEEAGLKRHLGSSL